MFTYVGKLSNLANFKTHVKVYKETVTWFRQSQLDWSTKSLLSLLQPVLLWMDYIGVYVEQQILLKIKKQKAFI